ncbi:Phospholipid methyltransferase [compost metagenome]|jgi:protein-S-isoprenylcysteine O-methyltransferase Ste14|uniref:methyltransferase family protein n=1 Tax=Cupriavidus necator TaxID=106590 RepID=UPI0028B824C7
MDSLELKIPPPVVALLTGLLMWLASRLNAPVDVPFGIRVGVAVAIACAGAVIGVSAMVSFLRAKTTMNPIKADAASSLVADGVFRFTRNPMYLSLLLYLSAWAVYLSNWLALPFLPMFVLYINRFQIAPEERVLSSLFGAQYVAYKGRVRRWL